jgi:2-(1,2-epoxy-1,2-dihydrophenyl)acetyl-CoA isomerase
MSWETITVEHRGSVALLTLDRPASLNALSLRMKEELAEAIGTLLDDDAVRALVLTGAGRAFCAGADLTDLAPESGVAFASRLRTLQRAIFSRVATAEIPVIAAVNGAAVGGGFSLAAVCDVLLVAPDAYFLAPHIRLGLAPDLGLLAALSVRVGGGRARALALTGERLSAEEAREWGLAHRVVAAGDLVDASIALATEMAGSSAAAIAATKRLMGVLEDPVRASLMPLEAAELALLRTTDEHAEAVHNFILDAGA